MLSIPALLSSRHSLPSPCRHHTADGRGRRRGRVSPSPSPWRSTRSTCLTRLVLSTTALTLLTINGVSASPSLPYIPTTILIPSAWPLDDSSSAPIKKGSINENKAYILTPRASDGGVDLLTLDFSKTLSSTSEASLPEPVPVPSNSGDNIPPFLTDGTKDTPFIPTILPNGTLAIISGGGAGGGSSSSCSSSTNAAKIYTYSSTISSSASSPHPSGVWTSRSVTAAVPSSWDASESFNPYFFASGISFSAQLVPSISEPVFYLYGGMCPYPISDNSSSSSSGNWQSAATYSNKMLRISPAGGSSGGKYTLEAAPSAGGPPVAEAGYTFTPLAPPSLATRSGGIVTQQMSYVMLGGHTQSAFVNMSTAAVWSLPEESWTFVAIKDSEPSSTKVDLAIKDVHGVRITVPAGTRKVDPRSGHSAVLSEDGTKLIILGGWVGDLNTPAEPQLVVLEVGGHGGGVGFEEWRWSIPPPGGSTGGLLEAGKGIYGHGAVLLPGDVMMVYGGYEISGTGSKKAKKGKRAAVEVNKRQVSSTGLRFLNISSMEWQDEYTHPSASSSSPDSPNGGSNGGTNHGGGEGSDNSDDPRSESTTTSSSSSKYLGLGVGLGVGIPVLLALLLAGFCLRRRQLRRRAERDEALRGLAQGVPLSRHGRHLSDEMMERNDPNLGIGFFPWDASSAQEWYTGGLDPYSAPTTTSDGRRRSLGYETLRGQNARDGKGLYQPPPMPPAPLMTSNFFGGGSGRPRGSVARGLYQPTTGVDGGIGMRSPNSRSNRIHPIYEADEDDDLEDAGDHLANKQQHPLSPDADDQDDPFLTPTKEKENAFVGSSVHLPPPKSSGSGGSTGSSSGDGSRGSPSPEMGQAKHPQPQGQVQDAEVQGWVSDVDAADAVLTARISRHGSTTTRPPALRLTGSSSGNSAGGAAQGQTTPTRLSPTRRTGSNRSGGLTPASAAGEKQLFDDGRTGSNLSDRSAFSFVQGAERAHLRTGHHHNPSSSNSGSGNPRGGGQGQSAIDRSESSSGSSAHTFSTAKSNFAAMQAEGPSLLMGGSSSASDSPRHHPLEQELFSLQNEYDLLDGSDEYDPAVAPPGSPSKSKPVRRSWFGSLRRVFSGATPSPDPSSRGDSPTRDSLLGGNSDAQGNAGGDSSSRLLLGMNMGLGPNGVLLRRKQGREAWEEILPTSGGGGTHSHHNHQLGQKKQQQDADGEWDVEKAVEQRLVQVMFTVPKERLRVVNADLTGEDDASSLRHQRTHEDLEAVAVLVDPERDGYGDGDGYYPDQDSMRGSVVGVGGVESVSDADREHEPNDDVDEKQKGKAVGSSTPSTQPQPEQQMSETDRKNPDLLMVHDHDHDRRRDSSAASQRGEDGEEGGETRRISPSPSVRSTSASAHTIHLAEMVRLERPRTRVLEMVESIESKSRDGSPSGSPVRG